MKKLLLTIVISSAVFLSSFTVSKAAIPVIDAPNLLASKVQAVQNVLQTLKQIKEYKAQLFQLRQQLINGIKAPIMVLEEIRSVVNAIEFEANSMREMIREFGSVEQFIREFRTMDDFKFVCGQQAAQLGVDCPQQVLQFIEKGKEIEKTFVDDSLRTVDESFAQLSKDAQDINRLLDASDSSKGHQEALMLANRLATRTSSSIVQLRAVATDQLKLASIKMKLDRQEKEMAAAINKAATESRYVRSSNNRNSFVPYKD